MARISRITVPDHVQPIVKFVFAEMRRQGITYCKMAERSGLARETLTAWRTRNRPDLESLEAVLGVLGYHVGPLHRTEALRSSVDLLRRELAARSVEIDAGLDAMLDGLLEVAHPMHRGRSVTKELA